MIKTHNNINLLPFSIIVKATNCDINAISKVLKHYDDYILALSTWSSYDKYGNTRVHIDEYLHSELRNKLVTRILSFDVT